MKRNGHRDMTGGVPKMLKVDYLKNSQVIPDVETGLLDNLQMSSAFYLFNDTMLYCCVGNNVII